MDDLKGQCYPLNKPPIYTQDIFTPCYDKVPETSKTVFAILLYCFRYLEAFGSIWILTVFAILHHFDTEKIENKSAKTVKLPNASKNIYYWNHLEV